MFELLVLVIFGYNYIVLFERKGCMAYVGGWDGVFRWLWEFSVGEVIEGV